MLMQELYNKKLISPEKWLIDNTHYLTIMGSQAYGVATDFSDMDIYGFFMPRIEDMFPQYAGVIRGFNDKEEVPQYQKHHIEDATAMGGKGRSYDLTIYPITRYFKLLRDCNPNILDSIYTPDNCVLHATKAAQHVRQNRKLFLHKGFYHRMIAYASSQLKKMHDKKPEPGSKRDEDIKKHGYDTKYAYHLIRTAYNCEQLLTKCDMDIQFHREHLKAIRRGEWKEQEIYDWFSEYQKTLTEAYSKTLLPDQPDDGKIKKLLCDCIEIHYGSIDKFGYTDSDGNTKAMLREIYDMLEKNKKHFMLSGIPEKQ